MKLNIEELARESGFHHETSDGWPIIMHDRLEDLIRLIVERCAQEAENTPTALSGTGDFFSERCAKRIRQLLED